MISIWTDKPDSEQGVVPSVEITMIALLTPLSCVVHGEKNGDLSVRMEIGTDDEYCTIGRILEVPTPKHEKQWFRIYEIETDLSTKTILARHVFYDLMDNFIEDTRPTNCTGAQAMESLFAGLQYQYKWSLWNFQGSSDVPTKNTAYWEMMNPVEALIGDQDNSFINRWGGVLDRDNRTFTINRDETTYFTVNYGKNLAEAGLHLDFSEVTTRIMPTVLKADGQTLLKLPEKYVDSPRINEYAYPKVRRIHYSDVCVGEEEGKYATEELAQEALRKKAAAEFAAGADLPAANGTFSVVDLSKTLEYENMSNPEIIVPYTHFRIYLGNGNSVETDMLAFDFDAITKEYTSITSGREDMFVGNTIQKQIRRIEENLYTLYR